MVHHSQMIAPHFIQIEDLKAFQKSLDARAIAAANFTARQSRCDVVGASLGCQKIRYCIGFGSGELCSSSVGKAEVANPNGVK
jgi:hypothetical protein